MNDCRFSTLAICYQNFTSVQRYQKDDGISTITFYKPAHSIDSIGVNLMYRRQLSSVLTFYSKLELFINSQEISIILGILILMHWILKYLNELPILPITKF